MLRPGVFLQDRYEILELIGSGGMSDVYKARCHKLNRLVAIKVLKAEFSDDANFVAKFKMEAQAAAGLCHPNIVNVYDVVDESRLHYIVMELIEGITLKSYISKKGHLETKEAVGIAIQVAQGIAAAHAQNIIHRDIKPQNIIISKTGKVKVADFGIARAATAQTLTSAAMGSVHYISPEQARGGYSDTRSDLYSLGITIYEMVTGKLPFEGDNTVTVALAHLEEPMTRPSIYNREIPISLEHIILKCTEKKPEYRYNHAAEVIADLRKVLQSPNEDFVKMAAPVDYGANTVTISPQELEDIKKGQKTYQPTSKPVTRSTSKPVAENEDVNPKIEKLMTAVGVGVAILIVAILIVMFSRLSGLFHLGSDKSTAASVDTVAESTLSDKEILMPKVVGLPEDMAETKLKESTLVMKVTGYQDSETVEKGYVIYQETPVGSVVPKYSTVNVTVSNGTDVINLTTLSLSGNDITTVKNLLESKGVIAETKEETNETIEKGKVIRYEPEKVKKGEKVMLYVSLGKAPTLKPAPSILNLSEEAAVAALIEAGMVPGAASLAFSDTVAAGHVISQNIDANTQLPEGSAISYVVSQGSETVSKRYLASISETYNLSNLIGPGALTSSIEVEIRLKQEVNGVAVYRTLMKPKTLSGEDLLPVNFPSIEGAPGVDSGEVQVLDVASQNVLKTYPITFFAME
ncbi:MAG: Stk1 family PASTA domain-containing Ser/Thr kinase [Hungatella sp.]